MRSLVIYVNEHFEEEMALYDLESNEVILKGDYYHSKISFVIEGYLYALGLKENEDVSREYINNTHKLFKKLDFYDDGE